MCMFAGFNLVRLFPILRLWSCLGLWQSCIFIRQMLYFLNAAVTIYHKLDGLKTTQIYYLPLCRSQVWHRSHWDKINIRFLFLFFSWLLEAVDSTFKASSVASLWPCFHFYISFSEPNQKRFSNFKDSCDYIGSAWIIQDNLPILES